MKMSTEIINKLRELHSPESIEDAMVYEVWNDGEITLTKGGELYGQRNLHSIVPGSEKDALPTDSLFPRYKHSRIVCRNKEDANYAVELIRGLCPYHTKWI
jgi:hypothetical protein